jgi:hypothetical protein
MINAFKRPRSNLISFFLVIIFVLSLVNSFIIVSAADSDYADIKGHWAEKYIRDLIGNEYIKGVKVGNQLLVQPGRNITRAEFLTILMRTGNYVVDAANIKSFSDVVQKSWFKESVDKATSNSILEGYPDGTFKPNNPISRAEIAALISKVARFNMDDIGSAVFSDVKKNKWYYKSVMAAKQNGIINGYPDGRFMPEGKATRAEVAVMVSNYLKLLNNKNSTEPSETSSAHTGPVTPKPEKPVISQPTTIIPGHGPYVTPPDDIKKPSEAVPVIYCFDSWSSNETELLYAIKYLNLKDLGAFKVKITYDPKFIVASRVSDGSAKASGYISQNGAADLSRADIGEITVSSNDTGVIQSNEGTLFYIRFVVLPGATGKIDINISGVPELYEVNGNLIDKVNVKNGSITFG